MTATQARALRALRAAGGKATVHRLVSEGHLPEGQRVAHGMAFAALERRGLVRSYYPSVESAGVSKVWEIA